MEGGVVEIYQIVPSDVEQAVAHRVMTTTLAKPHKPNNPIRADRSDER